MRQRRSALVLLLVLPACAGETVLPSPLTEAGSATTASAGGSDATAGQGAGGSGTGGAAGSGGMWDVAGACDVDEPCADDPMPGVPFLLDSMTGRILEGGACLYVAKNEGCGDLPNCNAASLWAVPKTCGRPAQIVPPCGGNGADIPSAALGPAHVYASCVGAQALFRAPLTGGRLETFFDAVPHGLATDASAVYFVSYRDGLVQKPHDGGPHSILLSSAFNGDVELRDGSLYFIGPSVDPVLPAILRISVSGGPTTTIALNPTPASFDIAVSDSDVFWIAYDDIASSTQLLRAPIAGGPTTEIVDPGGFSSLAIDGTHVYWSDLAGAAIRRVPLAGGPTEELVSGQTNLWSIHVDKTAVYWGSHQGVWRLGK